MCTEKDLAGIDDSAHLSSDDLQMFTYVCMYVFMAYNSELDI